MKKIIVSVLALMMLMGGLFYQPVRKTVTSNIASVARHYPVG